MPILFSVVAFEENILANFASCEGNLMEIVQQVLSKIFSGNDKMTYSHGPYLFHYIIKNNYCYFCITDKLCQRSRAFLFLNEIQRRFILSGKDGFDSVLAAEMYRYSEDYSTITIRKGELDELNSIGVDSSGMLVLRSFTKAKRNEETILGEKILYVKNIENMSYSTVSYVGKAPEHVMISVDQSRRKLYVVIIGLLSIIFGAVYTFGPMSCLILICIIVVTYFRSITFLKKNSD